MKFEFPAPPSAKLLGWEFEDIDLERGWIKIRFLARSEFLNPAGTVQGGILSAMIDDTMGPLLFAMSGGKSVPSTIDLHVHFLKPVLEGPVTVEAEVTQMGKTIAFVEGRLFNAQGDLAARGVSSCRIKAA
jgi:uncharacterized protein (TIGR00369 family)